MSQSDSRRTGRRIWVGILILTAFVLLYPVEWRVTRIAAVTGVVAVWVGALWLCWPRKVVRIALLMMGTLPVVAVCLPGRSVEPEDLAADYSRGLRSFRGVRYVWGGENWLGIDCSGLVRKGLVWGQLRHGLLTANGASIRDGLSLWSHDGSAMALRDGYRGWTRELFRADSILGADASRLRVGDLAVTSDGLHVLAYLGNRTWIEADPGANEVVEVVLPTDNPWFRVPVVFVRWRWLESAAGSSNVQASPLP